MTAVTPVSVFCQDQFRRKWVLNNMPVLAGSYNNPTIKEVSPRGLLVLILRLASDPTASIKTKLEENGEEDKEVRLGLIITA